MADLFGSTPVPKWESPADLSREFQQTGMSLAAPFGQAFDTAYDTASQRKFALKQQQVLADKLKPVADSFRGVDTPAAAWEVASKHPEWMADPQTAPFVTKILKQNTDIAKAEVQSMEGKAKIAKMTEFTKRKTALPAEDQSVVDSISSLPDGTPSPQQWQSLTLAEQTIAQRKENERKQAEIEALQRGESPTTTITEKGVTQTFRPESGTRTVTPQISTQTVDGRKITLITNPKTGRYQVLNDKDAAQAKTVSLKITALDAQINSLEGSKEKDIQQQNYLDRLKATKSGLQAQLNTLVDTQQGTQPTPPKQPATEDLVTVTNPSGKTVRIKRSQLDDALKQGYKAQ